MANIAVEVSPGASGVEGRHGGSLAILATVFFMWGFITVLNDVLIPHLRSVFDLNYTQATLIQFVFFGTYFLISLPAAKFLERFGYRKTIAAGLATTGVGALIFVPAATLPSYAVFLTGLFVLASGITTLQVAANPYVALLGPPATASSRLNLVQAFNSLGTTVAPLFGGLLILAQSTSGTAGAGAEALTLRRADRRRVGGPHALYRHRCRSLPSQYHNIFLAIASGFDARRADCRNRFDLEGDPAASRIGRNIFLCGGGDRGW